MDGTKFGRDFDFNRPFFEQFFELSLEVPKPSLVQKKNENCEFTYDTNEDRDCYLVAACDNSHNCHYGSLVIECRDCADCDDITQCELCVGCAYCDTSFGLVECSYCSGSSNCFFSSNLVNCHNCIFCIGLQNKRNCIFNVEVGADVFETFLLQRQLFRRKFFEKARQMFEFFKESVPQRFMFLLKSENVTGDKISNSKNCENCYAVENTLDSSNCAFGLDLKDCMDCWMSAYGPQKCFENQTVLHGGFNLFGMFSTNVTSSFYFEHCHNSQDLFGCSGIKNKKYCILNKQYSKEEYETLKTKIIEHLKKTNEWGQFFPIWMSPFPYNSTMAHFYYPLDREKAKKLVATHEKFWPTRKSATEFESLQWMDPKKYFPNAVAPKVVSPPDSLLECSGKNIVPSVFSCKKTKKPFRVIGQELAIYQKLKIPLPDLCPMERFRIRNKNYNPRLLHDRKCAKCAKDLKSTFAPDDPRIILCETHYREYIQSGT